MNNPSTILRVALVAMTVLGAGAVAYHSEPGATPATAFLRSPRALPDFELHNARSGTTFGTEALNGQWTLIYTGYLNCPDLCPTTTALLSRLSQRITAARKDQTNINAQPTQFALLSIDHFRDTDAAVLAYTNAFEPSIIPLTGNPQALAQATRALGLIAPPIQARSDVAHSSAIALIGPNAQLRALFRYPHSETDILSTLLNLPVEAPFTASPQEPANAPNPA